MEFQASILRKCTKLYNKGVALLVDPPNHVDKIKKLAKNEQDSLRDFDEIYTRKFDLEDT